MAKSKISSLLDQFDENRKKAEQAKVAEVHREETFVEQFNKRSGEIFRPTLQALAKQLQDRGHFAEIREREFKREHDGKVQEAEISLEFNMKRGEENPKVYARLSQNPHLAIISSHRQKEVYFHESTLSNGGSGHSGGAGSYPLEEVTAALIEAKFEKVLSDMVR